MLLQVLQLLRNLQGHYIPYTICKAQGDLLVTKAPAFVTELIGVRNGDDMQDEFFRQEQVRERVVEIFDAIHKCGVVHGDVARRNLVLSSEGLIFLVDFGHAIKNATADQMAEERDAVSKMLKRSVSGSIPAFVGM